MLDNPFVVGEAIGAALVLAVLAYVVTRRLCGPAGARHLARLNRLAGEEVHENRVSLYVRDWLPYAAAVFAALVGGLFSLVKAGVMLHRSFAARDMPQLVAGFRNGCQRSCVAQRDETFCAGYCDCTLATLRTRHPDDDEFASWMQAGPHNLDAVRAELSSAQTQCMNALEPSSATTPPPQQPARVTPPREQVPAEAAQPTEPAEPPNSVPQYEPRVMQRIHEDLAPFLSWAAAAKAAPEKLSGAEVCATASEPSPGICTKSVAAPGFGDQVFSASYKYGAAGAVRIAVTIQMLVGCDALAPSRTLAQWQQGEAEKQLCEISSGALGGMQLLAVRSRQATSFFAFTPSYLDQDPTFRATAKASR